MDCTQLQGFLLLTLGAVNCAYAAEDVPLRVEVSTAKTFEYTVYAGEKQWLNSLREPILFWSPEQHALPSPCPGLKSDSGAHHNWSTYRS
jgi:hypothetical protein